MNKTARMMLLDSKGSQSHERRPEHREGDFDQHHRYDEPHRRGRRVYMDGMADYEDDEWRIAGTMSSANHGKFDEHTAREWMEGLENEDGTKGPHWTMEQTKQFAQQKGVKHDPVVWWAAMNMIYSDYCGVAKKLNINNVDFYVYMAQAFLDDKDAGEGKLEKYYRHVVR